MMMPARKVPRAETEGQAGRIGAGGATNSGGHLGAGGSSLPGTGGGAAVGGTGGIPGMGGSLATGEGVGSGGAAGSGTGATGGHGGTGAAGTGGSSGGSDGGTGGARGGASGMGGAGIAGTGGSAPGTGGTVAGHGGSMGTGGTTVVTCGTGLTNCSGSCVNLQTDANHCGGCNAPACGGTCQSGLCCTGGKTNCGGTCVDLSSDDKHCGGCNGSTADCTMAGQALHHCRAGTCRLADGYSCTGDSDCYSGKCDVFYGDSDKDGYPNMRDTARFCTFPANSSQENGPAANYIAARSDGKWDCCDHLASVHPGATQFVSWGSSSSLDPQCVGSAGDTNCDGTIEVDPAAVITTGCNVQGDGSCDVVKQTPTSADCGKGLCGCGAPAPNSECVLYCAPSGPALGCR
jgi:hypothetical protein